MNRDDGRRYSMVYYDLIGRPRVSTCRWSWPMLLKLLRRKARHGTLDHVVRVIER